MRTIGMANKRENDFIEINSLAAQLEALKIENETLTVEKSDLENLLSELKSENETLVAQLEALKTKKAAKEKAKKPEE